MIDYDKNKERFDRYMDRCRRIIETRFFSEEELKSGVSIKKDRIESGLSTESDSLETVLREHRKNLLQIKIDHTMRIVGDVTKIANSVGAPIDFVKTVKVAALLHDIGRFKQAILNNSYGADNKAVGLEGMYHAQYGKKMLVDYKMFDYYEVPPQYRFAVSEVVLHHQDATLDQSGYLNKFKNAKELDTERFLSGNEILNEHEKVVVAALLQMVRDVDMLDILYQNVSGEFPTVRQDMAYKTINPDTKQKESLETIAKHWGVNPKVLKEYNGMKDGEELGDVIKIPVSKVPPEKFAVPLDIQKRFFQNEDLNLKELTSRRDWVFITGMWWRLNHFLNNISFLSNLEILEQNEVLEKIYATYPDEYKPLVEPAFAFAKRELLEKVIQDNKDEIYVKKR